jgi:hypothetical protein
MAIRVALYVFEHRGVALLSAAELSRFVAPEKTEMSRPKWYSPQLRRDLVTRLYFRAKAEGLPMTRLVDRLIEEALGRPEAVHEQFTPCVAEDPPTAIVPG